LPYLCRRVAPDIKRPVDIGILLAGLQSFNTKFRQAARWLLYGQTVRIPRFIVFSGGHWTAGFKALPKIVGGFGFLNYHSTTKSGDVEEAVVGVLHPSVAEEVGMDSPAQMHGCRAVFLISVVRASFLLP